MTGDVDSATDGDAAAPQSLYRRIGEPVSTRPGAGGGTIFTATKETLDNDRDVMEETLLGRG